MYLDRQRSVRPLPASQCFTFANQYANDPPTNTGDYTMQNPALNSLLPESISAYFRPQYGPGADKWLVQGVLPMVGVALIEAATLEAGAQVADDIGSCVVQSNPWGGRACLQGQAIAYGVGGFGHYVDDPECSHDKPAPPELELPAAPYGGNLPAALLNFPEKIAQCGGARLLIVQLTDEASQNPATSLAAGDLARELQCCVLLVTAWGNQGLRNGAEAVLQVGLTATATDPGQIEQPKPLRGSNPGVWAYTLSEYGFGGDANFEIVDEVVEVAPRAN